MTVDEYFEGYSESRLLFDALAETVARLGPVAVEATRSQVAFRAGRAFAWAWVPARYLGHGAPLVLSVSLRRRDLSERWKEVVEPVPGRFMHHLELMDTRDIDDEVIDWIAEARAGAAPAEGEHQ